MAMPSHSVASSPENADPSLRSHPSVTLRSASSTTVGARSVQGRAYSGSLPTLAGETLGADPAPHSSLGRTGTAQLP
jgi:hypothetical protein